MIFQSDTNCRLSFRMGLKLISKTLKARILCRNKRKCHCFVTGSAHTYILAAIPGGQWLLIIAWLQFYFANLLNVYTDLRLWGPLSLGQSDTGRQRDDLHDRWDDDGITEITRNKVISGPGRSRLMMLCSLLPRLRWKLPRRQEWGASQSHAAVTIPDTSVSSVTSDASHHVRASLRSWQSKAGEHSSPGYWALQIFRIFSETTFVHQYHFR